MRRQPSFSIAMRLSLVALGLTIAIVTSASCQESTTRPPAAKPPPVVKKAEKSKASDVTAGPPQAKNKAEPAPKEAAEAKAASLPAVPAGFVRLGKTFDVWINPERKLVVVDGKVCLRQGQLEMFACPRKSKEHESIVAVNSDAKTIHAALLAVGALPGSPVKFDPKFTPPSGTQVDLTLLWIDAKGEQHKHPAQEWIRHVRTKKQLEYSWVFAGSGFWTDEDTKQQHYQADAGDLVCVSNFPTATLDLPVASSQDNADLEFEAFTERIPPVGTAVRLVFQPKIEAQPKK